MNTNPNPNDDFSLPRRAPDPFGSRRNKTEPEVDPIDDLIDTAFIKVTHRCRTEERTPPYADFIEEVGGECGFDYPECHRVVTLRIENMWIMNALSKDRDFGEYMVERQIADQNGVPGITYRERALRQGLIEENASYDEKLQAWFALFNRHAEHHQKLGNS